MRDAYSVQCALNFIYDQSSNQNEVVTLKLHSLVVLLIRDLEKHDRIQQTVII